MSERYDVCIIGGGAAGMTAAIAAARQGCKVCLIDRNKKLGKKLYATGNGRCNLANADMDICHYHSSASMPETCIRPCMGENPKDTLFSFLHTIGVYEQCIDGYYYPKSMQASAVVWAFLDELKVLSVTIKLSECIQEIQWNGTGYTLKGNEVFQAEHVILACGGKSYPALGGCDCGYELAKQLGISQEAQRPALCGLYTNEDTTAIKGVRVACSAYMQEETVSYVQKGELQITEYGLSGIMMFNLASHIGKRLQDETTVEVLLDFLETVTETEFMQAGRSVRSLYGYLNAYLPDKLALYILQELGIEPKQMAKAVKPSVMRNLYQTCRKFPFHITSLKSYDAAQVTAGGIALEAVCPETMQIKGYEKLYAVGEMLDVDGDCGGYNLAFAILTGLRAGRQCHVKD